MPPPTDLKKATDALHRLVQEEKSYFEELKTQAARLAKTKASEDEDGNKEFQIKQEERAMEETRRVIPTVRAQIPDKYQELTKEIENTDTAENLKEAKERGKTEQFQDELFKAKSVMQKGEEAMKAHEKMEV